MQQLLHENKTFEKVVYTGEIIKGREFQDCTFKQCDLSGSEFLSNKLSIVFLMGAISRS
jgi:fluoroquinolone resistance protein